MWWDKQNKYVYVPGILGIEQRGVCTDDGELLLLCYPCHQKPPHLHAVLDPQRAQDGQLPKPSGKGFTAAAQICALYIYFNGLHLRLHQLFNLLLDAGIQVLAPYWKNAYWITYLHLLKISFCFTTLCWTHSLGGTILSPLMLRSISVSP